MTERVLYIDDEELHRRMFRDSAVSWGYEVDLAKDGKTALELAFHQTYDTVVVDFVLEGENGFEVLQAIVPLQPAASLVLISASFAGRPSVRMFDRDVYLLPKPWSDETLRKALARALGT